MIESEGMRRREEEPLGGRTTGDDMRCEL